MATTKTDPKVIDLAKKINADTGVLASITLAQYTLESANGTSELAIHAHNYFGIKNSDTSLQPKTTWDGVSVYTKQTEEQDLNGNVTIIIAAFRKYFSIDDSMYDHAYFLLKPNYRPCFDYASSGYDMLVSEYYIWFADQLRVAGYATDIHYPQLLKDLILENKWHLLDL